MLNAPRFWYRKLGLLALLLSPLGIIYSWIVLLRSKCIKPYAARIPVASIGNIVMGGSGKTPVTIAIAKLLTEKGLTPAIVTRGYGGSLQGPVRVSTEKHMFSEVGDEALMLCQAAPTFVAKKREEGVKMAEAMGADIVLLDDGHQNCRVQKDISLVVFNEEQKYGNGLPFPAGPLRESLDRGMARADGIIYLGSDSFAYGDLPVFPAEIKTLPFPYAGKKVIAFCGLGFPKKFKESLLRMGCKIEKFIEFPDHHPYSDREIEDIIKHSYGLPILTTEKDYIRIPELYDSALHVVEIELVFNKPKDIVDFIVRK